MTRALLRKNLCEYFDLKELEVIVFDLDENWDDIAGSRISEKALHMIRYFEKRGRLEELIGECQRRRPHVSWPKIEKIAILPVEGEKGTLVLPIVQPDKNILQAAADNLLDDVINFRRKFYISKKMKGPLFRLLREVEHLTTLVNQFFTQNDDHPQKDVIHLYTKDLLGISNQSMKIFDQARLEAIKRPHSNAKNKVLNQLDNLISALKDLRALLDKF